MIQSGERNRSRRRRRIGVVTILICFFLQTPVASAKTSNEGDLQVGIRGIVLAKPDGELSALYEKNDFLPLWYGTVQPQVRDNLFAEIRRGAFYGVPDDPACVAIPKGGSVPPDRQAAADVALSDCLLRLRTTIALGAVPKDSLGGDWSLTGEAPGLTDADILDLRKGNIRELLARASPPAPEYAALQTALAFYMDLDAHGGWPTLDTGSEILLDGTDTRGVSVQRRLALEDYISPDNMDLATLKYAVQRFQADHGLMADGRVGRQTVAAFNVPAHERVAQIAVNMERWRHLPRSFGPSYVLVNVADATLKVVQDSEQAIYMRTIVGDVKHPTPVFHASITAITFNPSWTIPHSIATKEILPKLKRNPKYLQENEIEILNRDNDVFGLGVDWRRISPSRFGFQLRQRPGSRNPLGLIKFEMANPYDVYLHDTPAKTLFALPRRGLSHGCIRVEQPETLALRLLPDQTPAQISEVVARGATTTMPITRPLPVYVGYWTAFAGEDGRMNFREDLYGRDSATAYGLGYHPTVRPLAYNQLINNDNCPPAS